MKAFKLSRPRVLVVGAMCLLAGYTGVRTAADITTIFTFRGQQTSAVLFGTDADGNSLYGEVTCIVGDNGGGGKPTPIQKAWISSETAYPDHSHYASTQGYNDFTGSYTGVNHAIAGTATCDATASGREASVDFTTWETTDLGAVTLHGNSSLSNPVDIVTGVHTTIVKNQQTGGMSRFRSVGKFGYSPSGTVNIEVTEGGSGTLPTVSGPVNSDWSQIAVVQNGRFSKIKN